MTLVFPALPTNMHDLHEANRIVKLVLEQASKNKLARVKKIVIELGDVVEHGQVINPNNLIFNIKLLTQNTLAHGAQIVIKRSKGKFWKLKEIYA